MHLIDEPQLFVGQRGHVVARFFQGLENARGKVAAAGVVTFDDGVGGVRVRI